MEEREESKESVRGEREGGRKVGEWEEENENHTESQKQRMMEGEQRSVEWRE